MRLRTSGFWLDKCFFAIRFSSFFTSFASFFSFLAWIFSCFSLLMPSCAWTTVGSAKASKATKRICDNLRIIPDAAAKFVPEEHTYLCLSALCTHSPLLMNLRHSLLLIVPALLLHSGCKRENVAVPLTEVDINLNLNLPEYNDLMVTGGWLYLTGGSEGIIVYRKSPEEFTAMDRHCTYQAESICRVTVDESGIIARDTTCCHSAFLLLDGSVTEGPATFGLKLYHTTFNGTTLHIFN